MNDDAWTEADFISRIKAGLKHNDPAGAEHICRTAQARWPANPAFQHWLGQVQLAARDPQQAYRTLRQVADRLGGQPDFLLSLALAAEWSGAYDDAADAYTRAMAHPAIAIIARRRLGQMLLQSQHVDDALPLLAQSVQDSPDAAENWAAYGLALACRNQPDAAKDAMGRALSLAPDPGATALAVAINAIRLGQAEQAVAWLREPASSHPGNRDLNLAFAQSLHMAGDSAAALPLAARITQDHPDHGDAWVLLAQIRSTLKLPDAVDAFGRASALAPDEWSLRDRYAQLLYRAGSETEALAEFTRCLPWNSQDKASAPTGAPRVAVLILPHSGNTPTRFLLDSGQLQLRTIRILPGTEYPRDFIEQNYDAVFNAVADADTAAWALPVVEGIVSGLTMPVINPPGLIPDTARDRMAVRLSGIPDAMMPLTRQAMPADLQPAPAWLAQMGPALLLRQAGRHGGTDLTLAETPEDFAAYIDAAIHAAPDSDLYVTQFVDYASPDGLYRKYRMVFVGAQLLPHHLSVSAGWLNHYFRGLMDQQAALRDEEAAFLNDPGGTLGPRCMTALAEIGRRIGLDYFGVDFAVLPDGRMLVFECNATMLVDMPQNAMFAYRIPHVQRIRHAMTTLLKQRVGRDSERMS